MPQLMLEGDVDTRDALISGLKEQVRNLQEDLRNERAKNVGVSEGVRDLKRSLLPLYGALQKIFGDMEPMGTNDVPAATTKNAAAWEQWKQRLGGATARAIDVLMVHGEMTQGQLRIILGCATRTVQNVVVALNSAKLIDKRDGKIRLKEL